jgi:hypothetical protein
MSFGLRSGDRLLHEMTDKLISPVQRPIPLTGKSMTALIIHQRPFSGLPG